MQSTPLIRDKIMLFLCHFSTMNVIFTDNEGYPRIAYSGWILDQKRFDTRKTLSDVN